MSLSCVDRAALRADLVSLVSESRLVARLLRQPFTRPMGAHQRTRARLARRITELLVLVAFLRGRRHVRARPSSWPEGEPFDADAYARAVAERTAVAYADPSSAGPRPEGSEAR